MPALIEGRGEARAVNERRLVVEGRGIVRGRVVWMWHMEYTAGELVHGEDEDIVVGVKL